MFVGASVTSTATQWEWVVDHGLPGRIVNPKQRGSRRRKEAIAAPSDVFISYARKDQLFVRRLHEALVERGRTPWVDWQSIPPTAKWRAEIRAAIRAANTFVFVISPDSVVSATCREEIGMAEAHSKRFVPLLHREIEAVDAPDAVTEHNWIFIRDSDEFEGSLTTLIEALDTDLDWVRSHTRLLIRAGEWDERGEDASLLLRGRDLAEAEEWLSLSESKEPRPTPLQSRYVVESRRAVSRSQRGRLTALAVGFTLMVVLAIFAMLQRTQAIHQRDAAEEQARIAQSRELAASALLELPIDSQLALLLAEEAVAKSPTAEAVDALRETLARSRLTSVLTHSTADGESGGQDAVVVVRPLDQGGVVTASANGRLLLWRPGVAQPQPLAPGRNSLGETGPFHNATVDAEGSRIAGQLGNAVQVWSSRGQELVRMAGHGDYESLSFSVDGRTLIGATGEVVDVWDAITGVNVARFPSNGGMIALSPDGQMLATAEGYFIAGDGDVLGSAGRLARTVQVFSVEGEEPRFHLGPHVQSVNSVVFSPDGTRIVTAAEDVRVWDLKTGKLLSRFELHSRSVMMARFSPDSRTVVTASLDGTARVFDSSSGAQLARLQGHDGEVWDAEFSSDGRLIVTASRDGTARVWNAATGKTLFELRGGGGEVMTALFSPDGDTVWTGSEDGAARSWEIGTPPATTALRGHTKTVGGATFSPDDSLVVTWSSDYSVRLWDPVSGRQVQQFRQLFSLPPSFDAAGRRLLTVGGGMDTSAKVWDVRTGERLALLSSDWGQNSAALSPDGAFVATADAGAQGSTTTIWSVADAEPVQILRGHTDFVQWVGFSPDGELLATGSADGSARLWDWSVGKELRVLCCHDGGVLDAGFSSDGSRLLTRGGLISSDQGGSTVRVWDVAAGEELAVLTHPVGVSSATLSPDGRLVATSAGGRTRIWEASGEMIAALPTSQGVTDDVSFSPDSQLIATAGESGSASIWRAATGDLIVTLVGHTAELNSVEFSHSGEMLVTSSSDATARVSPSEDFSRLPELLALAAQRSVRGLTPEESRRFLSD